MSESASDDTLCNVGGQKDMGNITSLTKTDKNQDFTTEGVTKGVEDDIPDDDCILSEEGFDIDEISISDKACGDSVNSDDSFMTNIKVVDVKEKNLSKDVMPVGDQQSGDHVNEVSTDDVPATINLVDKVINNKNMTDENTRLFYDNCGKLFPNEQDGLSQTGYDNTVKKRQIKEESHQYPHKATAEKKSQIRADISKEQPEISCSTLSDKRVNCSHNSSGKNNENHVMKRSFIIEALTNILSRNQKQLENNMPVAGAVTAKVKSQNVDNKKGNKSYLQSLSSFLSDPPTETRSINSEARKLQRSSVTSEKLVLGDDQVRKQLKSGHERVVSQLEKLEQAIYILPFDTDSFALTTSESLKNQIKGMMTAVTQMYQIVYNMPQKNLSFLDTLHKMATQLNKAEEEILKVHDTTLDPATYLLNFQKILDSLREGEIQAKDTTSH